MTVRVITPPTPIVTPADIAGAHTDNDPAVAAMIQAVTEEIDGPGGWLGRALGPQTLELIGWFACRRMRLPCAPVIKIESVVTEDRDGNTETADASMWRQDGDEIIIAEGAAWVTRYRHRIRFKAGYNGTSGAGVGEIQTGAVPERARQAIILSVQDLIRSGSVQPGLRSETVEDVGSWTYLDSDKVTAIVERTCQRLLSTLRIYTL
jgi:hypothetical protein